MAKDIIPGRDGALLAWLKLFKDGIAAHGASYGLSPAEILQAQNLCVAYINQINNAYTAKREAIAANTKKKAMRKTHLQPLRKLIRFVKANPAYTRSAGISMAMVADGTDFQPKEYKPVLKAVWSGQFIQLRFKRKGVERLNIYGQRDGSAEWMLLGSRARSPFYFRPPGYVPGSVEKWKIKAVGVLKDEPVGKDSDHLTLVYHVG